MAGLTSLNVFAVLRTQELGNDLRSAMALDNGTKLEVRIGELKALGSEFRLGEPPDVLLLDVDMDDAEDLEAFQRIKRDQVTAKTAVVATSENLTTTAMRHLLRDGIDDFIPQPLSPPEVLEALRAAEKKIRETTRRGRVFSFVRASGGTGATTLAVHCAFALRQGRKKHTARVCLIDLDVQFGAVGLHLDLDGGGELVDLVRTPDRLDAELMHGMMSRHRSGLDVLNAPSMPIPLEALRPDMVGKLLDVARQEYEYVVVDLPHALTAWIDAVLLRSDVVAVVTQLSVPAVRQTRKLLDVLQEEGHYALPVTLILNRYKRRWRAPVRLSQAQKALGREFDYVIPNDYDLVMSAVNRGVPAYSIKRRSKFGKGIRAMVQAMVRNLQVEDQKPVSPFAR
jgi:pilus assembly protein CpaE